MLYIRDNIQEETEHNTTKINFDWIGNTVDMIRTSIGHDLTFSSGTSSVIRTHLKSAQEIIGAMDFQRNNGKFLNEPGPEYIQIWLASAWPRVCIKSLSC